MSAPKLARILDVFGTRLAVIDGAGDYLTRIGALVMRTRLQPSDADLPCCLVYLDLREATEQSGTGKAKTSSTVVVEGYVSRTGNDDEGQGIDVLADIQRAVESDDDLTLGGLLLGNSNGLQFSRDEILYPEHGDSVVGGRVEYLIPHLRLLGDPETA